MSAPPGNAKKKKGNNEKRESEKEYTLFGLEWNDSITKNSCSLTGQFDLPLSLTVGT